MNIKVIDNFISLQEQNELKDLMVGRERIFPWFFIQDVTNAGDQNRPAVQHEFYNYIKGVNSDYLENILPVVKKFNRPDLLVLRANSFLQFPNPMYKEYDTPHIDMPKYDKPYTIVLYYVCDSEGETIFFNSKNKVIKKVMPKQGRVAIFDGSILHTAYQPTKSVRCILNFNINNTFMDNLSSLTI